MQMVSRNTSAKVHQVELPFNECPWEMSRIGVWTEPAQPDSPCMAEEDEDIFADQAPVASAAVCTVAPASPSTGETQTQSVGELTVDDAAWSHRAVEDEGHIAQPPPAFQPLASVSPVAGGITIGDIDVPWKPNSSWERSQEATAEVLPIGIRLQAIEPSRTLSGNDTVWSEDADVLEHFHILNAHPAAESKRVYPSPDAVHNAVSVDVDELISSASKCSLTVMQDAAATAADDFMEEAQSPAHATQARKLSWSCSDVGLEESCERPLLPSTTCAPSSGSYRAPRLDMSRKAQVPPTINTAALTESSDAPLQIKSPMVLRALQTPSLWHRTRCVDLDTFRQETSGQAASTVFFDESANVDHLVFSKLADEAFPIDRSSVGRDRGTMDLVSLPAETSGQAAFKSILDAAANFPHLVEKWSRCNEVLSKLPDEAFAVDQRCWLAKLIRDHMNYKSLALRIERGQIPSRQVLLQELHNDLRRELLDEEASDRTAHEDGTITARSPVTRVRATSNESCWDAWPNIEEEPCVGQIWSIARPSTQASHFSLSCERDLDDDLFATAPPKLRSALGAKLDFFPKLSGAEAAETTGSTAEETVPQESSCAQDKLNVEQGFAEVDRVDDANDSVADGNIEVHDEDGPAFVQQPCACQVQCAADRESEWDAPVMIDVKARSIFEPKDRAFSNTSKDVVQDAAVLNGVSLQRTLHPAEVTLQVYAFSQQVQRFGLPIFHLGVEVYGDEHFYSVGGVDKCKPCQYSGNVHSQSVPLGNTTLSYGQVLEVLEDMAQDWRAADYAFLGHNCQDFAIALCTVLGVARSLPADCCKFANMSSVLPSSVITGLKEADRQMASVGAFVGVWRKPLATVDVDMPQPNYPCRLGMSSGHTGLAPVVLPFETEATVNL